MADRDEYDALLDEPFGSDVDWTAIDGMAGPAIAERDDYFSDDGVLDESFLRELRRLEDQAMQVLVSAPQRTMIHAARPTDSTIPRQIIAGPSSATTAQPTLIGPHPSRSTSSRTPSVLTDDRTQVPYTFGTTVVNANTLTSPSKRHRTSCQTPSPSRRKRRKTSVNASPHHKAKGNGKQKAPTLLEAIDNALQCPICFDTIAASHVLSCGHSACGLCLCEWIRIKGDRTTCCVCRASHRGPLIPNYTLDEMVLTYFNQKGKSDRVERGESDAGDRKQWEKRNAEGKAAVKAAAQKYINKVSPAIVVTYDPYDDPYDPYDYLDFDENGHVIW